MLTKSDKWKSQVTLRVEIVFSSSSLPRLFKSQLMFSNTTLCAWTMIWQHTIYLQCQRSVPMQETLCPLLWCSKNKGCRGCDAGCVCSVCDLHGRAHNSHPTTDQTFVLFFLNRDLSLTLTSTYPYSGTASECCVTLKYKCKLIFIVQASLSVYIHVLVHVFEFASVLCSQAYAGVVEVCLTLEWR